jgi:uncharacterized protein involved in response to NO
METRRTLPLRPIERRVAITAVGDERRAAPPMLLAAPHRLTFFTAALMLALVSGWWALLLIAPYLGLSVRTTIPPTLAHGFTFAAAFMPLFMAGFMYTAGPRWLDVPAPPTRSLLWPVSLHVVGVVLLLAGTEIGSITTAFGALLLAIAWTAVGVGFAGLIRASRARDRLHAKCVMAFWAIGIASALLFAAALGIRHYGVVAAAVWIMILGFITPIYATVVHRLLPFFTSNAVTSLLPWRPNWVLGVLLGTVLLFGSLQLAARTDLMPVMRVAWLTLLLVGPGALVMAALALRWGLVQSLRGRSLRLLAMLHLGFVWLAIALGLAVLDAVLLLVAVDPPLRLGLAPLHALTMGFLGGMLFAMATRVVSGHGGIALVADNFVWALFWTLQAAVLLRLASPFFPAADWLSPASAIVWTVVWVAWAARYLPVLAAPRRDGRPG